MFRLGDAQTVYVRSQDRTNTSDSISDFTYEINLTDPEFDSVCLKSCSFPKSWYIIQAGYNTFTLREASVNYTITIPPGNYNTRSLTTEISLLLTSATVSTYTYVADIALSTEVQTGKILFSVSGNAGAQPSLIFGASSPYLQLGFAAGSTNVFVGDTLTSTNVIYLQQANDIILVSDVCKQNNGDYPILQALYINSPDFTSILYLCPDVGGYACDLNYHSSTYRFTLMDHDGRILNLNGLNWSFSLVFFKRNDADEVHKKALLLQNYEQMSKLNAAQ